MNFLKNIFGSKEKPVTSYSDFWDWFQANERKFFKAVKAGNNIETEFFSKLSPKLNELKEGFYYLTGMSDHNTAELIITADGAVKNIVFVEELVNAAPVVIGWKFTALKQGVNITDVNIQLGGQSFNKNNISFYENTHPQFPDEIDVTVVHHDMDDSNREAIINGIYLFLDNFLGELNFATTVDSLNITGKKDATAELVPIEKLKAFLIWREKEFVEKYEGVRHKTEDDTYNMLEAKLDSGNVLLAVINSDLLAWDKKASHPWVVTIDVKYDGSDNNGMPDQATFELLDQLEAEVIEQLTDVDGYLNIGRQTAENVRTIFFACRDFRKPSKVLHIIKKQYAGKLDIGYSIYKDKYWQSFDRFMVS